MVELKFCDFCGASVNGGEVGTMDISGPDKQCSPEYFLGDLHKACRKDIQDLVEAERQKRRGGKNSTPLSSIVLFKA